MLSLFYDGSSCLVPKPQTWEWALLPTSNVKVSRHLQPMGQGFHWSVYYICLGFLPRHQKTWFTKKNQRSSSSLNLDLVYQEETTDLVHPSILTWFTKKKLQIWFIPQFWPGLPRRNYRSGSSLNLDLVYQEETTDLVHPSILMPHQNLVH
jgi:hypothetical protein